MGHSLLIFSLVDPQASPAVIQGLPQTAHDTVAEYGEDSLHKLVFLPDVLCLADPTPGGRPLEKDQN